MNNPKITHILADGRQLDTIKGYLVKRTKETEQTYRILSEAMEGPTK